MGRKSLIKEDGRKGAIEGTYDGWEDRSVKDEIDEKEINKMSKKC